VSGVDLRQLALLVHLHDRQSLSEAARHVHMTPSAASQSLQRLRAHLDDELVLRQGGTYVPTPLGEGALEVFRDMLQLWTEISAGGAVFDPASSRAHWSVACAEDFTEIDLDACYAAIVTAAPTVRLDLVASIDPQAGWDALRAARLDVVMSSAAPPEDANDLHAERYPDALLTHACFSVAHPRIGGVLSLEALAREPHVRLSTPDAAQARADPIDEALVAARLGPRHCACVPTMARWSAVVASSDRLALVTAHQGAVMMRMNDGLRMLPLPEGLPRLMSPRYMVWHHRTQSSAAARWLRERLRSFLFTGAIGPPAVAPSGR
jgi:DNA-binding transcriptional LysR family regulator